MRAKRTVSLLAALVGLFLAVGCEDNGNDSSNGGGTTTSGSYAGTWTGHASGRGLTMNLSQNGTALSGSYALTNPDFGESVSGSVSSETPPASATLIAGGDRSFKITFDSYHALHGGFYKGSTKAVDVDATK